MLLKLFLDQIPNTNSLEYWKGVIQNGIGCTIGSFLAIWISYLIYRRTTAESREQQKILAQQADDNTLRYFAALFRRANKNAFNQLQHIENFNKTLQQNDLDFPLLTYVPLFNFQCISESTTLQSVLTAYINQFPGEKAIGNFNGMIANSDFLYTHFTQIPDIIKNGMRFHHERLVEYQKLFKKAFDLFGEMMMTNMSGPNDPFRLASEQIMNIFQKKFEDTSDLNCYYTYFMEPVNKTIIPLLHQNNDRRYIPLGQITRDGLQLFNSIKMHNIEFSKDMEQIAVDIKSGIADFEKNSSTIVAKFPEVG